MATSELPTYKAVFATLRDNAALCTAIPRADTGKTRVFDLNAIPEQINGSPVPFPYLVLGETTCVPKNVFTKRGDDITLNIHLWSSKNGKEDLETLHNLVDDALFWNDLSIEGYTCLNCECEYSDVVEDDSTGIHLLHGIDRYRIWTRKV